MIQLSSVDFQISRKSDELRSRPQLGQPLHCHLLDMSRDLNLRLMLASESDKDGLFTSTKQSSFLLCGWRSRRAMHDPRYSAKRSEPTRSPSRRARIAGPVMKSFLLVQPDLNEAQNNESYYSTTSYYVATSEYFELLIAFMQYWGGGNSTARQCTQRLGGFAYLICTKIRRCLSIWCARYSFHSVQV